MALNFNIVLLVLLISVIIANESSANSIYETGDTYKEVSNPETIYGEEEVETNFLQGSGKKADYLESKSNSKPIDEDTLGEFKKTGKDYAEFDVSGAELSFYIKNNPELTKYSKPKLLAELSGKGENSFGFSLFGNSSFEVVDSSGVFNRVFRNDDNSNSVGPLIISLDKKLWGDNFGVSYLTNFGLAFFQGRGYFESDLAYSDTRFTLWFLPVDLGLAVHAIVPGYFKLIVGAGGTVMGAIQSRSDLSYEEDGKLTNQIGVGYFASLRLMVALNKLMPNFGMSMFSSYRITENYLTLDIRNHQYDNFKDDYSLEGTLIGLGLVFEFF